MCQLTGESLCQMLCETNSFEERQSVCTKVIELGSNIKEPLAYLAVAYAYSRTRDEKAKALPFYEKWEIDPIFYDKLIYPEHLYLEIAEIYEKEYQFDKTIECLQKYFAETYKHLNLVTKDKKTDHGVVKFLIYRAKGEEADFYYQFYRIGEFYRKMGTQYALQYWESLRLSPYYEEGSEFKYIVDQQVYYATLEHKAGYVYKPLTKANQAKFLAYAKEKGWR